MTRLCLMWLLFTGCAPKVAGAPPAEASAVSSPRAAAEVTSLAAPPLPVDTDGDGVPDAGDHCPDEVGLDRYAGCPNIDVAHQTIQPLQPIWFAQNTAALDGAALETVAEVAEVLVDNPEIRVMIEGHANPTELDVVGLSQARADAVRDQLAEEGVLPDRMDAWGRAETRPIDSNQTEDGRRMNSRVEVTIR